VLPAAHFAPPRCPWDVFIGFIPCRAPFLDVHHRPLSSVFPPSAVPQSCCILQSSFFPRIFFRTKILRCPPRRIPFLLLFLFLAPHGRDPPKGILKEHCRFISPIPLPHSLSSLSGNLFFFDLFRSPPTPFFSPFLAENEFFPFRLTLPPATALPGNNPKKVPGSEPSGCGSLLGVLLFLFTLVVGVPSREIQSCPGALF